MRILLVFYLLGPAVLSTVLTWAILAPEEMVPFWPVIPICAAALGLTIWSQVWGTRFMEKHKDDRDRVGTIWSLRIASVLSLGIGPFTYFLSL